MRSRDYNEICAKCGYTVGNGHNSISGCLFNQDHSVRKVKTSPQFFEPTKYQNGRPYGNNIVFPSEEAPQGRTTWRVQSLRRLPTVLYIATDANGGFTHEDAEEDHVPIDFDTKQEAEEMITKRCIQQGLSLNLYAIVCYVGKGSAATTVAGSNANCATCKEAFPYDPMPSNRKDGGTDCGRCKMMNGVFR